MHFSPALATWLLNFPLK